MKESAEIVPHPIPTNHTFVAREYHGMTGTKEYNAWALMLDRCRNPNNKKWRHYGGRGITVCEEWKHSFLAFYRHIGPRPSPHHSLDRIDNNGNYEPGNVRWATDKEQCRNTRQNNLIEFRGEMKSIIEWSEKTGLDPQTIRYRLFKGGWTKEEAFTTPAMAQYYHPRVRVLSTLPAQQPRPK